MSISDQFKELQRTMWHVMSLTAEAWMDFADRKIDRLDRW